MGTFEARTEQRGAAVVVTLEGSAGVAEADAMRDALARVAAAAPSLAVIDLTGLSFLNSQGIASLVALNSSIKRAGGSVRLAGINASLRQMVTATRLDSVMPVYPTAEAALAG